MDYSGKGTVDAIVRITDGIKSQLIQKRKVMLICIDGRAAFDLARADVIIESLRILGVGDRTLRWLLDYLSDRKQYVQCGGKRSEVWLVSVGVVQGGLISPDLYNVLTLTLGLWNPESETTTYADDSGELVAADTVEECESAARRVVRGIAEWYDSVGLQINPTKSEIMSFGFEAQELDICGAKVKPTRSIRFLGCHIQDDLRWHTHVETVAVKLRQAAGRIRNCGRLISVDQRRQLYHAWAGGILHANALAYLPHITTSQTRTLQTAANSAVRAVVGAPHVGPVPMTEFRSLLKIESVAHIRDRCLAQYAWTCAPKWDFSGPDTRGRRAGMIPLPDLRGWSGSLTENVAKTMWNKMPSDIKKAQTKEVAKSMIKSWITSQQQ